VPVFSFADVQLPQQPNMQCIAVQPIGTEHVFQTLKLCIFGSALVGQRDAIRS